MNLSDTAARELREQGRVFATRHGVMVQASNPRQFRRHVLLTSGSAFALAQYTEERVRTRRRETKRSGESQLLTGIQRLEENTRLLRASAIEVEHALKDLAKLPAARNDAGMETPRIVGVAHAMLKAARYQWSIPALSSFIRGYQTEEPLNVQELWAMPVALKLVLLEEIVAHASGAFSNLPASDAALEASLRSLHDVSLPVWSNILEPLVPFETLLCQDPAGAYSKMDFDSRDMFAQPWQRSRPDRR